MRLPVCLMLLLICNPSEAQIKPSQTQPYKSGMVVTCQRQAAEIGVSILRRGGNAADAFVATTLAEYVTASGYTSLSGPLYLLYHDQKSRKTLYLNAGLNTVRDPNGRWTATDPKMGATYVVGGAARGLEELKKRFGSTSLSLKELVAPAAELARTGFVLDRHYAGIVRWRSTTFERAQDWQKIYRPNGILLNVGDRLYQTELADTLDRFGKEGADYIFKGAFAESLVKYIRAAGGKLTLEDLKNYRVNWDVPLRADYNEYSILSSSYRSYGGYRLLLNLKVLERTQALTSKTHFSDSPEQMNLMLRSFVFGQRETFPLLQFATRITSTREMQSRLDGDLSNQLANLVRDRNIPMPYASADGHHSCNTIVVDRQGNIATGTHTINALQWGEHGMFVKGVSINTAHAVALDAPPGERATSGLNPVIIFRNRMPVIAAGFFSSALHPAALQILVNLLHYGMNPKDALARPRFGTMTYSPLSVNVDARFPKEFGDYFARLGVRLNQPDGFIDTGMGMVVKMKPDLESMEGASTELLPYSTVLVE